MNTCLYCLVCMYFAGIPVDVMHDVLEGVLQLEISCLLNVLVCDLHLFSLGDLNNRISKFAYGNDVSDPPKPLSNLKFKMEGTCIVLLIKLTCIRIVKLSYYYSQ